MEEEKKLCTPQHSINGYVPKPTDLHLSGKTCDCKKLIWITVNSCGCSNPKWELIARPNI